METGGEHLSVALWRLPEELGAPSASWQLLASATSHSGHRHAEALLVVLDELLSRHGLEPRDLALVAAGRGPGGFTGVRVALSTALGISLGTRAAVWPVDSLAALARNAAGAGALAIPLLDARRGEVYGAVYEVPAEGSPICVVPARVGPPADVHRALLDVCAGRPCQTFGSGALAYDLPSVAPATWHVAEGSQTALCAAWAWEAAGRRAAGAPAIDPAYVRAAV